MDRPALLGGTPVTSADSWPAWPQWNSCEERALREVLASGRWQAGPQVEAFEREFAEYQGAKHAICVTNGTTSLEMALRAAEVGPGDEVIVPSYTFAASALAVMTVGAKPVLVDIEPDSLGIDPLAVESAVGEHTRAVMPVHVGGRPVDMDQLLEVAHRNGLAVVEDAAHGHGSEWRGARIGSAGFCASFSFQTGKSMTSGDGGCLVTGHDETAYRLRSLRNFGRGRSGEPERAGGNYRMTEFQAAVLRCQLGRLDEQIARRQENVALLRESLEQVPGVGVAEEDPRVTRHPYYQVVLNYDAALFGVPKSLLLRALAAEGVPLESGYLPLHRIALFREAGRCLPCPVSERAADESVLWLSFRMALAQPEQIETVARALLRIHRQRELLAQEEEAR
ncbi:MAG TPA: DegT/DnrJ/EryC1/StrS family aminotransferase [Trueperaceae bacterium]